MCLHDATGGEVGLRRGDRGVSLVSFSWSFWGLATTGKQFCLPPKGDHQSGSLSHSAQGFASVRAQLSKVLRAEVWQLVLLPVRSQILRRIQFWCIAGKKLHPQSPALLADELPGRATAMPRQSASNDQQLAGNVA